MFRYNAMERKGQSTYSISSTGCSFQDIHKKTKYWFTRKQKGCLIIFWSVIELGNVHCTGVNSGKEEKETRGTLTNGIIGTKKRVMFVEATPNGQLAKAYRKALKKASLKIRVVERAGKSMKKMLTKSDPFREGKCSQNKCKMCKLDSNTNCKGRGVVYQIKCQGCTESSISDGLYVGETARSIGERVNEHLAKYEVKDKNSVFQKHIEEKHKGERQDVKVKVVSSCGNDAMLRQVTEAILIKELNPELNTKDEWGNSNALRERDRIRRDNLPTFFKEDIIRTRNSNNSH